MRLCSACLRVYKKAADYCEADGSALRPISRAHDPLSGRVLGERYRLIDQLGVGGMGFVYSAEQLGLGRRVAVKMLFAERTADRRSVERLRREALALATLDHPGIVSVLDYGEGFGHSPYIVMEMLKGQSLEAMLAAEGCLQVHRAVEIALQIAAGLSAAHAFGIVHRDLKPANVQVEEQGLRLRTRILDFGMALLHTADESLIGPSIEEERLTRQGMIVGTPQYMAPEQIQGAEPDARTDLYALGIVLFEILTGRPPFVASRPAAVCALHVQEPAPLLPDLEADPAVTQQLRALVAALLEKDPSGRPSSAAHVQEWLASARSMLPGASGSYGLGSAPDPTARIRLATPQPLARPVDAAPVASTSPQPWFARRPRVLAAIASVLSLVAGGAVWLWQPWAEASRAVEPPMGRSGQQAGRLPPLERVSNGPEGAIAFELGGGARAPGGDGQTRYEASRRRVETSLAERGLKTRDLQGAGELGRLWDVQEEAARAQAYEDAELAASALHDAIEELNIRQYLAGRLARLERQVGADAPLGVKARLKALRATAHQAGTSSAKTRRFLERLRELERQVSQSKR